MSEGDEDARPVIQGFKLDVTTEIVDLPNGNRVALDLVHHPGAAAVVPFLDDERVLLIRQYRFATGGEILEVPAGKLDPGESPEVCAARELEEETGHRAGRLERLGSIWASPGFCNEIIHLFAAYDLEETDAQPQPDEVIELVPTRLDAALDALSGPVVDGKTATALLLAARRRA